MSKTVEDVRRELFESSHKSEVARLSRVYGAQPSLEVAYDKDESGLYLSGLVQAAWWGFNAALDAVGINLPLPVNRAFHEYDLGYNDSLDHCESAIEQTGLGLRVL